MRDVITVGMVLMLACLGGWLNGTVTALQDSRAPSAAEEAPRVDLNRANQATLETLPGIGPRTAELIIEYRTESGGFQKVEELMNVRGIGERTFLRLRELVSVEQPEPGR